MLKRLLFPSRPAFLLPKTAWKAIRDPDVCASYIRVCERCRPGSSGIPTGGAGMFICHVRDTFMSCFYILSGRKRRFFQMVLFGAMAVFVSWKHKQHITRHINKSTSKKHDRYSIKTQQTSLANPATAAPPTEVPYPAESSSAGKETSRYPSLPFL